MYMLRVLPAQHPCDVWPDFRVILSNQKSVFTHLVATWFVARQVWTRGRIFPITPLFLKPHWNTYCVLSVFSLLKSEEKSPVGNARATSSFSFYWVFPELCALSYWWRRPERVRFVSVELARYVGRVLYGNTVEPSVSYHPKCENLVVTYERWWHTRNRITGVSSEMSGHFYFMEDNLLHAIFQATICAVPCYY